ncbi:hypothetical protein F4806DRAFT_503877 [Annulohypoxylon nitens]|nr:hypothetical protein F4806DRAFT_503877 [Annulohypoxylon nitens]
MSQQSISRPIFLVTHPRACSTAFERVFLTREDDIACVHEPFSDAYHWGPEKLSERYEDIEKLRADKGLEEYTYLAAFDAINRRQAEGKRVFIKDMGKCLMPLPGDTCHIAPSLQPWDESLHNEGNKGGPKNALGNLLDYKLAKPAIPVPNPTVIPSSLLSIFSFAFLIRNPRLSIPSLYECSSPPRSLVTGWHGFKSTDAGYAEMRRLFDYLMYLRQVGTGPDLNSGSSQDGSIVVDAEDLLAYPESVVSQFCDALSIPFSYDMLRWDSEKDQLRAAEAFKNWAPFHDTVLKSTSLQVQSPKISTPEADFADWTQRYGRDAAALIQKNIDDNMGHYLYLKMFAIKPFKGSYQ